MLILYLTKAQHFLIMTQTFFSRLFVILLLGCISIDRSHGQNPTIDSLQAELKIALEDTSKVILLNSLAYQLHIPNPTEGINYAKQSIALASRLDFDRGRAHAYNSLGASYWNKSELDSALKYYTRSYQLNDTIGNPRGMTGALSNMAIIYENRSQYLQAITTYTLALEQMELNGFDSYIAITSNNLGLVYYQMGDYPKALSYFNKAIEMGQKLEMSNLLGPAWTNVSNVHSKNGNMKQELSAIEKALEIGKKSGNNYATALAFNNLGRFYLKKSSYDSALSYYRKALVLNEEVGRKRSIATNKSNIGQVFRGQSKYDSSLYYLNEALDLAEEIKHPRAIRKTLNQLGITMKEKSGCVSAISFFKRGYEIAVETNAIDDQKDLSNSLSECYRELGDYEKAVVYQSAYMSAKDSILNEENIKELARVEAEYLFESQIKSKQSEIDLLEANKQIVKLRVVIGMAVAILVIGLIIFIAVSMIRKRNQRNSELNTLNQFKETMTGMIAHDLKNPLSMIMNANEIDENKQVAGQMLHLINNMLDVQRFENASVKLNRKSISVSDLVYKAYTQVSYLQAEKNVNISIDLEDVAIDADHEIMLRVLVNLLTNAIKYSPLNSEISIVGKVNKQLLELSIRDQGIGIDSDELETAFKSFGQLNPQSSGGIGSTGLGLTFVKLAVEAHGFQLFVNSEKGKGATFTISSPILSQAEDNQKEVWLSNPNILTNELKETISNSAILLRKLSVYQIGEIEKELSKVKNREDKKIVEWIEAVLNAAYSGNQERYKELLHET